MLFFFGLFGLWKLGAAKYLWYAGMGLTGMILSKETYILHVAGAITAALVLLVTSTIAKAARDFLEMSKGRHGIIWGGLKIIPNTIVVFTEPIEDARTAKQT